MVLGAAGTAAMLARASAPAAPNRLVSYTDTEDIFEMTERELWGEDAGEILPASASAPSLGLDHTYSSDSDEDDNYEPPSPDIKAFHGEPHSQQSEHDMASDSTAAQPADESAARHSSDSAAQSLEQPASQQADTGNAADEATQPFTARRSTDSTARRSTDSNSRQSFESASAVPISGVHRSRRPPLRANSTFVNRDGMRNPRAAVKMGSSAPINIPLLARIPFKGDEDEPKKPAPFVPPHLVSRSNDPVAQQQNSIFTGESLGASVKREKLQQRNAILRRTGFLEGPPRVKGVAEVMDPIKESHLEIDNVHSNSALTAALGSSPSVGDAAQ